MVVHKSKKKDLKYYLALPWSYTIEPARDEKDKLVYIIRVNEIPEACTDEPTVAKGLRSIKKVLALVLETYLEQGQLIPEPADQEHYKGNISYRTSARRHHIIAQQAKQRNLSLSQVIDSFIDAATTKTRSR